MIEHEVHLSLARLHEVDRSRYYQLACEHRELLETITTPASRWFQRELCQFMNVCLGGSVSVPAQQPLGRSGWNLEAVRRRIQRKLDEAK